MRKLLLTSAVFTAVLFGFGLVYAPKASAIDVLKPVCDNANQAIKPAICSQNPGGGTNPLLGGGGLFSTIVRILSYVAGVSAVAVIVVAGLKIVLSNGDTNALATARKQIIYAVVGLAVIAGSNAIIGFVLSRVAQSPAP